ncbi:hypothetical protein MMC29_002655 [Sticta canariensis]|nr:hypothetical protein [Sticta canariensis]
MPCERRKLPSTPTHPSVLKSNNAGNGRSKGQPYELPSRRQQAPPSLPKRSPSTVRKPMPPRRRRRRGLRKRVRNAKATNPRTLPEVSVRSKPRTANHRAPLPLKAPLPPKLGLIGPRNGRRGAETGVHVQRQEKEWLTQEARDTFNSKMKVPTFKTKEEDFRKARTTMNEAADE